MLKSTFIFIFSLFLLADTYAMTFDEVWKLASKDNPGIQAAIHSYKAQLEQTKQARAGLLPSITFDASMMKNSSNAVFTNKSAVETKYSENYDSSVYTLKFIQPVFRAESLLAYEEAKKYPKIGKILLRKTYEELFGAVLEAFVNVLFNKEYLNVTISKKNSIVEQMNDLEKRFELGDATVTDLTEAKARYDLVLAEEIAVNNAYVLSKKLLAITANLPESEIDADDFATGFFTDIKLNSQDYWINKAKKENVDIVYKKAELAISEIILRKEKSKNLPTVDFTASYTNSDSNGDTNGVAEDSEVTSFGLNFRLPLIQGGGTVAGVREKAELKFKTIYELQQVSLDVTSTISNIYSNLLSTHARINAFQMAIESAKLAVIANEKGFAIGTRTNVDLLDAKEQYYKIRKDYYQTKLNYILSYYGLLTASGRLAELGIIQEGGNR